MYNSSCLYFCIVQRTLSQEFNWLANTYSSNSIGIKTIFPNYLQLYRSYDNCNWVSVTVKFMYNSSCLCSYSCNTQGTLLQELLIPLLLFVLTVPVGIKTIPFKKYNNTHIFRAMINNQLINVVLTLIKYRLYL